ncbi:EamA-like transporter family [Campylobacter insulaenigrae]|uniref:DMT family transporter n=1 Tax=Campylobacter insulaenigrae TaxID=260714 RepID=UPI000F6CD23C|nr:DMT family transporter [Campylobacter insulaenigrae]MCR6591981.1 DMT family transporter [Campylobacter insulaenigrae]MCR6593495.1 DMT family transporter [Campylobacter insulaenigrae]VEJ52238.1 EamA-like transporter family [Campylobacter insulaenigrae]
MNKLGYIAGALSGLFWALAGIFYVKINEFVNYSYLVFVLLFCIEFVPWLFLTFSILFLKKHFIFEKKLILPFIAGFAAGPVAMYCYLNAILFIGLSFSASITSLYPIFATFLAFIFLKERLNALSIFGMFAAFSSLFFLFFDGFNLHILGLILAFVCALSWGLELVLSSIVLKKLPTTSVYYARQTGSSFGYAILILIQKPNFIFQDFISLDFFILSLLLIFSWAVSYFLYYFAIAKIGIVKAMMLNISYVIWLVLIQQEFNFKQIISIILIFIGVNLVLFAKRGQK